MRLQTWVDRVLRTILSVGVAALPIMVARGWLTAQDASDVGVLVAAMSASWHGSQYVTGKSVNDTVNTLAGAALWARSQTTAPLPPDVAAQVFADTGRVVTSAPKAEQHPTTEGNQP